jgi:pantoate--beta-alanine ligase
MLVFTQIAQLKQFLKEKGTKTIGFVPTMGALHKGHVSLIEEAKKNVDITICSIFVNPIQFNDKKDLEKYPRPLESDIRILESASCDVLFNPTAAEVYPDGKHELLSLDFGILDKVMEGAFRPGHFKGVAIVVKRLFEIVEPDYAYFGEKDYQQLAIIKSMVKQLNLSVKIVGCPIIREANGLAMSSRNTLLNSEEKNIASKISMVLFLAKKKSAHLTVHELKEFVKSEINKTQSMRLEYFEIADAETLAPVFDWEKGKKLVGCIAVYVGNTRLIDNIIF